MLSRSKSARYPTATKHSDAKSVSLSGGGTLPNCHKIFRPQDDTERTQVQKNMAHNCRIIRSKNLSRVSLNLKSSEVCAVWLLGVTVAVARGAYEIRVPEIAAIVQGCKSGG
jgi:hypothetical protein